MRQVMKFAAAMSVAAVALAACGSSSNSGGTSGGAASSGGTSAAGLKVGMAYDVEREEAGGLVGALVTPAAFRFGPKRQFELALFGGPTYNIETEFFGGVGGQSFSVLFL